jgi:uncharacterized OsmC-like protein
MNDTDTAIENRVNGVSLRSLFDMIDAIRSQPWLARFQFRARNQWLDGGHTRTIVKNFYGVGQERKGRHRPFVLESDLPALFDGGNTAINPLECLLTAIGACMTTTLVFQAAARGINVDAIECSVEGDIDLRGFLGLDDEVPRGFERIKIAVNIEADLPDNELDRIVDLGTSYSPILELLSHGTQVIVERVKA